MAWRPDLNILARKAMQQDWNKMFASAFPFFSLLGQVIKKVIWQNEIATILMTPTRQTQTFYTLLLRMSIQRPLFLPALPNLLLNLVGKNIVLWKPGLQGRWCGKLKADLGNGWDFKQCSQNYLHVQKTRFHCRLQMGSNK